MYKVSRSRIRRRPLRDALALTLVAAGLLAVSGAPPTAAVPRAVGSMAMASEPVVLFSETFDSLAPTLLPRVNDPGIKANKIGFTHVPPTGWSVTKGAQSGGVTEWNAWSFTTRTFWVDAENQKRSAFSLGDGIIAVADSDEFADVRSSGTYSTLLRTNTVDVTGRSTIEVSFDSHYRQEGAQRALVTISYDGGAAEEVLRYDASTSSPNRGTDVLNTRVSVPVAVPVGARDAVITFDYGNATNNWFWAVDDVLVTAAADAPTGGGGDTGGGGTGGDPMHGVLWRETFDSLQTSLQPRVNDPNIPAGRIGFTHEPPTGFAVTAGAQSGGVTEWNAWSFTTLEFWRTAELQQRNWFTRADGVIAVADSDEFADVSSSGTYGTVLRTPAIDVAAQRGNNLEFSFDSHYRQEGNQRAIVTASFDGAPAQELMRYDSATTSRNAGVDVLSARETLTLTVPATASTLTLSFDYGNAVNNWFWAIDDLELAVPLPPLPNDAAGTTIHVISDVQGDTADLGRAVNRLNQLDSDAKALYLVGDVVSSGTDAQYTAVRNTLTAQPHVSGTYGYVIGNHEFYNSSPSATSRDRFLQFAGRDKIYEERVIGGVPILSIGTESYDYAGGANSGGPFMDMSEEQLTWLEERVTYWSALDKPVFVMTHHVLPYTVSGTYATFYQTDWAQATDRTRVLTLLSKHSNVILFTGHTHWSLDRQDWLVRETYPGGDPYGFAVVNTGAIWNVYGPSGDWDETAVSDSTEMSGLRVTTYPDRVRLEAYDFYRNRVMRVADVRTG